ncbi:MAG: hypothetical protein ACLRH4_06450, partial [Anaerobutyricum hallii]
QINSFIFLTVYLKGSIPKRLYICDFSRGGLDVRLCARIQTLLRGHKYRGAFLFEGCLWLDF